MDGCIVMDLTSVVILLSIFSVTVLQLARHIVKLEIEKYGIHGKCICNEDIYMENEDISIKTHL